MKYINIFIFCACLFGLTSKVSIAQTSTYDNASESLRNFYLFYLEYVYKNESYEKVKDSVRKYCTSSFLKGIHNGRIPTYETDMLMHVQELSYEWKDSFKITTIFPLKKYRICITGTRCVDVLVKKINGVYKIDNILATDDIR